MARQVTGRVPGWAGTLDGAQAGPRTLSWAEENSRALDRGGMEVDRGRYGLFVVLSGPWEFGVQTGVTHHSIPDWLRLSGTSGDHLVQMEPRVQTRSGTRPVRPRCWWGTRGSEAPGRNAGAAPAAPCLGPGRTAPSSSSPSRHRASHGSFSCVSAARDCSDPHGQ